mmetsp:Transcript_543/g.2121  ORF Transcript_543/g.2121 Transcript_543/m.2121 type:complete len:105 (-) Transcript_543:163-477(-)
MLHELLKVCPASCVCCSFACVFLQLSPLHEGGMCCSSSHSLTQATRHCRCCGIALAITCAPLGYFGLELVGPAVKHCACKQVHVQGYIKVRAGDDAVGSDLLVI